MLRCHYEVVAVEAADFVSPESNCYTAPFGQNRGMMDLLFGQSDNAIGKGQCISEILEAETPLQPLDPVPLEQRPFANLWLEIPNLSFGHSRRVGRLDRQYIFRHSVRP